MPHNIAMSEEYHTGYIKSDMEYPTQPVKLIELEKISIMRFSDTKAYPLRTICEALGYSINWDDGIIHVSKGEEAYTIDTNVNPEIKIIDGISYATSTLFYTLFDVSFRYFDDIGVLEIFK